MEDEIEIRPTELSDCLDWRTRRRLAIFAERPRYPGSAEPRGAPKSFGEYQIEVVRSVYLKQEREAEEDRESGLGELTMLSLDTIARMVSDHPERFPDEFSEMVNWTIDREEFLEWRAPIADALYDVSDMLLEANPTAEERASLENCPDLFECYARHIFEARAAKLIGTMIAILNNRTRALRFLKAQIGEQGD